MTKIHGRTVKLFFITALAGASLHFVYQIFPSLPTALFAPVNESIWEHVKIIFWPFLAASLFASKKTEQSNLSAWLAALWVICWLMLGLGWIAHVIVGIESFAFDIALYVAVMALGFWLAHHWQAAARHEKIWCGLTALFILIIVWFTFSPLDASLFADPALADAWYQLPC